MIIFFFSPPLSRFPLLRQLFLTERKRDRGDLGGSGGKKEKKRETEREDMLALLRGILSLDSHIEASMGDKSIVQGRAA